MLAPLVDGDPRAVGIYRLHGRLGEGGMGVVYLGFTPDDTPVAIKFPHRDVADDPEFRARFRQEVAAARRVRGSFVAEVLDADVDARRPWMATAYVDGVSLADAVRRRGRLEGSTLTSLAVGLADALVAIHAAGVVHRDLKPANIIMAWDGPKVIDFGIAKVSDASAHTKTGLAIGTVAWMAPEQLTGERAGPPADIFAWGSIIAFAATGRHPFAADTTAASFGRVLTGNADLDGIPAHLTGVIARALTRQPADRPSAGQVVAALAGRDIEGATDAEEIATRIVRGGIIPPALAGGGVDGRGAWNGGGPAGRARGDAVAPTQRQKPWDGWQTPPPVEMSAAQLAPSADATLSPDGSSSFRSVGSSAGSPTDTASDPAVEQAEDRAGSASRSAAGERRPPVWKTAQRGWFGQSYPFPLPVLGLLAVAGFVALIPVAFRAPELVGNVDVWTVFDEFGLAFLALPVSLLVLILGNTVGVLRDGAAGCAFGLSATLLGQLGFVREAAGNGASLGPGWWLVAIGACITFATIGVWRGFGAGWSSARWLTFAVMGFGVGVVAFGRLAPRWRVPLPGRDQPAVFLVLAVAVLLLLATVLKPDGGVKFFTALCAGGLVAFELFGFEGSAMVRNPGRYTGTLFADSFAVLFAVVGLGLLGDRNRDQFFLFTGKVAAAAGLLRMVVRSVPLSDRAHLHLVVFGLIGVLAIIATRRASPPPSLPPWQPPAGMSPHPYGTRPY